MSEEQAPRQRRMSPEAGARRAERKLMIPIRERIAELQTRVAFLAARAVAGKAPDRVAIESGYGEVQADIDAIRNDIDRSFSGPSLGPADDCRRALRTVELRLPQDVRAK